MEKQPTEWGNSFASYSSERILTFQIHKELKKIKHPQRIMPPIKQSRLLERSATHTPVAIRKMQVKGYWLPCLTQVTMVFIEKMSSTFSE